ncbi:MAG: carbohydrate kinase family protein [Erysipelotrichaceae bacterium]|nr:carbohydrate kinase family protein [Erysipelotrichaceae bacterium]
MRKYLIAGPARKDTAVLTEKLPKDGEELRPLRTWTRIAGSGWNTANAFQSLNMDYDLISPVGTGISADAVLLEAQKRGIVFEDLTEEIHGSSYTVIDQQGRTRSMIVPGAECVYSEDLFGWIDPDDYEGLILSEEALVYDDSGILFAAAEAFAGKLHLSLGLGRLAEPEEGIRILLSFSPVVYTDNDAMYELPADKNAGIILKNISAMTGREVLFQQNHHGVKMIREEEMLEVQPLYRTTVDRTGTTDALMAAYCIAVNCGLRREDALQYAAQYSSKVGRSTESCLSVSAYAGCREELASFILKGRKYTEQ